MAVYWDTSCVLKLYCPETDSGEYVDRIEQAEVPPVASALLTSELYFAFCRKFLLNETGRRSPDSLQRRFFDDVKAGRFFLVPLGGDVQDEAARIARRCYRKAPPILLRTLDGLHLATAVLSGCHEMVTTDERMRAAATLVGLRPQ